MTGQGQVITVFAPKGGCGKTTFATNLAVALHGAARRVCLVDLDLAYGDIATTLTLRPRGTLSVGDTAWVTMPLAAYRPGLDCVPAPARPGDAERMPATVVRDLLILLSTRYDYVVVDTPARLSAHVLTALDLSTHRILLTTPERPALTHLRVTLDMLDLLSIRQHSRAIVVNRADAETGLTAADIDAILRNPIAAYLPSTWELAASINSGVPLTESAPQHPFSTAVRRFADTRIRGEEVSENVS
ncbi:AAA family ATPase [Actinokineospora xionganensis]|uniref:AAA family ATPase n=1 Tax=Actinokineospora xionganensis TaxID=2684470 RepID=A0ABR7KZ29_9PSEU|nr:AAA family ATPase [Actinokineospora xionganensis]MBC6445682.1 AAA family ATPase [Actinokineospora xionganensis]